MKQPIELRDSIEIVLKGKWLIAVTTILCIILSGVISWAILPEKYESSVVVQVVSGVQDTGIMQNYVGAEFTPQIYMQRLKNENKINEAFKNKNLENEFDVRNLSILNETNTNLVFVTYLSDSAENAQEELTTILDVTKSEMNSSVQDTLKNLEKTYKAESESLSQEIETIINEYNKVIRDNKLPEVLILQTILDSEIVLDITEEQTIALSNVSGQLQNQLLQLQSQIQIKSGEFRSVLADYQSVKTGLDSFKPDPFIRVISEPTLAIGPSSPNKILNLVIGIVLGVVIGLGLAFFRHYWRNSTPMK
nr:Wzz/FepE/Etk N-terminal domain-containing protein [Lysinibacillus timonensis]